jgi:TetR/AcrR family tetracycline transcriptional repressor
MAIDRDRIIDEAMRLLNDVGIDKLTTRKLAERLGVQQPALYWHFKNKSALLDAVNTEMVLRHHASRLPSPGQDWAEFTYANARSMRKTLLAVRDGARLTAGTRPSVTEFADAEQVLKLYVDAGFSASEAFGIAISVTRYVVGYVLEEQGERERNDEDADEGDDPMAEVAPFPLLSEALQSLVNQGTINTEEVFEAGLKYMVDGMRLGLAAKAGRTEH